MNYVRTEWEVLIWLNFLYGTFIAKIIQAKRFILKNQLFELINTLFFKEYNMRESYIKIIGILIILFAVIFLHFKLYNFSAMTEQGALQILVCLGRVTDIDTRGEIDQILKFRILSGQFRGETVQVNNIWYGRQYSDRVFSKDDIVYLDIQIRDPNNPTIYSVSIGDYFRTPFLLYLAGTLCVLMILVAGMKGVPSNINTLCYCIICHLPTCAINDSWLQPNCCGTTHRIIPHISNFSIYYWV